MKSIVWAIAATVTLLGACDQAPTAAAPKDPASLSDAERTRREDEVYALIDKAGDLLDQGLDPNGSETLANPAKVAEAGVVLEQALSVSETHLGDSAVTADILGLLGLVYVATGREEKSIAAYERSIGILKEIVGPDDPALVEPYGNLAVTYQRVGRLAEAEAAFLNGIRCARGGGPKFARPLAGLYTNLAELYDKMGRSDAAFSARIEAAKAKS